jgi:hypothetical protein
MSSQIRIQGDSYRQPIDVLVPPSGVLRVNKLTFQEDPLGVLTIACPEGFVVVECPGCGEHLHAPGVKVLIHNCHFIHAEWLPASKNLILRYHTPEHKIAHTMARKLGVLHG